MSAVRYFFMSALAVVFLFSSCSSYQQQADMIDGMAGAQLGTESNEALGQNQEVTRDYARYGIKPDQPSQVTPQSPEAPAKPSFPSARKTEIPNEVESPYPPYQRINVEGFKSGQAAKDPKTGKIFLVP